MKKSAKSEDGWVGWALKVSVRWWELIAAVFSVCSWIFNGLIWLKWWWKLELLTREELCESDSFFSLGRSVPLANWKAKILVYCNRFSLAKNSCVNLNTSTGQTCCPATEPILCRETPPTYFSRVCCSREVKRTTNTIRFKPSSIFWASASHIQYYTYCACHAYSGYA